MCSWWRCSNTTVAHGLLRGDRKKHGRTCHDLVWHGVMVSKGQRERECASKLQTKDLGEKESVHFSFCFCFCFFERGRHKLARQVMWS